MAFHDPVRMVADRPGKPAALIDRGIIVKVGLTSVAIVAAFLVCFGAVCGWVLTAYEPSEDLSQSVAGQWSGIQYNDSEGPQPIAASERPVLSIGESSLEFSGYGAVQELSASLEWSGGTSLTVLGGTPENLLLDMNTHGQLRVTFKDADVSILFEKT